MSATIGRRPEAMQISWLRCRLAVHVDRNVESTHHFCAIEPGGGWREVRLRNLLCSEPLRAAPPHRSEYYHEDERNIWLSWDGFWGGVMMRRVDSATGKLSMSDSMLHNLAARPRSKSHDTLPVEDAIDALTIIRHGDHWYLFVSFDFCCRGAKRDYKVVVGRADKVTGPYVDRAGRPMSEGGGTLVIEAATDHWRGAGHQAVFTDSGVDYLVFHAYSAETGRSRLQISTIE
jgi:arabinan endo-1,5-alpha-L-arabinosidase